MLLNHSIIETLSQKDIQLNYTDTSFTIVWKIIDFYYNKHEKQTNSLLAKEAFLNITAGGTHSFHWS